MKTTINKLMSVLMSVTVASTAIAAAPTIDSFNIQSYLKLSNNVPVSATSANFVFAIFKGSSCIWAKRYSAVPINTGVINQQINGNGTNITSISNASAAPGECVINFSGTTITSTLLNTGSPAALSIRIYAETSIDTYRPIWDIPLNSAPTAFVADVANSATSALTANDLAAGIKVAISAGAGDVGKFPILNASGVLDNSVINQSALSISKAQVTGLGTAASVNTGTTIGTIPVLGASGRLAASTLPSYTANKIMATDGTGVMNSVYDAVSVSGGASDSGKIPLLNGSGKFDNTMVDSTTLTPNPANLSTSVAVNKGGTGLATIPTGTLMVGAGTAAVTTIGSGANLNILVSNGTTWNSAAPSASNLVDMSSTQASIGGAKTFTGAVTHASTSTFTGAATFNSTVQVGSSGTALSSIIKCTITSAVVSIASTITSACAGVTTSAVVQCSPTVAPTTTSANYWVLVPYPTVGSVNIDVEARGAPSWTTGWNCIAIQ